MIEHNDLANEKCEPSSSDVAPMTMPDAMKLLQNLHEAWSINAVGRIERAFLTKDFLSSLELGVLIGGVAQEAQYFPDLVIQNGILRVEIWSRPLNGLSRADFVLAAKIDAALFRRNS
jgi:4a-hydroxytetrahydrobiopterin dehydratase